MKRRVLSVQDLSCVGQCSLTAALPVISACGVECSVLPTALLSNHTGAQFSGGAVRQLWDCGEEFLKVWMANGIRFDGIGIGYLGAVEDIDLLCRTLPDLKGEGARGWLDPAMADHGRFYRGFDAAYGEKMKELAACCDVLLPNLTEACLLAGETPREDLTVEEGEQLARRLTALGPDTIILKGLDGGGETLCNLVYEGKEERGTLLRHPRLPGQYSGTGDLFAAVCLGKTISGVPLTEAVKQAGDFVGAAITATEPDHTYGVQFEGCLGMLIP